MAVVVQDGPLEEQTLNEGPDGFEATQTYTVTGLDQTLPPQARMSDALFAQGIPRRLAAHPSLGATLRLVVSDRQAVPMQASPDKAHVTITYRPFNLLGVTDFIGSTHSPVVGVDTTFQTVAQRYEIVPVTEGGGDNNVFAGRGLIPEDRPQFENKRIQIQHIFFISAAELAGDITADQEPLILPRVGQSFRGGTVTAVNKPPHIPGEAEGFFVFVLQAATVDVELPMQVRRYTRREIGSPDAKAQDFIGTINSKPFLGSERHFWMCTRLNGTSRDGGETWFVDYEFQRHPGTWDPEIFFLDSETGEAATVLFPSNEFPQRRVQVVDERDFNLLNLATRPGTSPLGGGP